MAVATHHPMRKLNPVSMLKPRARKVKILATLGPASSSPEKIRALMEAGADAFRINMSHGKQADKAALASRPRLSSAANPPSAELTSSRYAAS